MTAELAADGVSVMGTVADWLSARLGAAPVVVIANFSGAVKKAFVSMTTISRVHWRAWDCAVRTEHAAVTGRGLEPFATPLAVVKELTRVGRHFLNGNVAAARACDRGL